MELGMGIKQTDTKIYGTAAYVLLRNSRVVRLMIIVIIRDVYF